MGLSRQKSAYLKDLGARVASGEVPIETLHELTDDEIVAALTQVKGIGRWTAQMFMMFRLGRPNVLPDLDLGIQKGIQRAYHLRKLPSPDRVKKIRGEMGTIPYSCVMVPVAVCRYTGEGAALIGMKLNSCSAYHALRRTKSA